VITICKGCLDNKQLRGHPSLRLQFPPNFEVPRRGGGHGVPPLQLFSRDAVREVSTTSRVAGGLTLAISDVTTHPLPRLCENSSGEEAFLMKSMTRACACGLPPHLAVRLCLTGKPTPTLFFLRLSLRGKDFCHRSPEGLSLSAVCGGRAADKA
jgi:hypothetical protein